MDWAIRTLYRLLLVEDGKVTRCTRCERCQPTDIIWLASDTFMIEVENPTKQEMATGEIIGVRINHFFLHPVEKSV